MYIYILYMYIYYIFIFIYQRHIQKDFHTGIPVWVPKFWCPQKEIYLYLH